VSTNKIQGGAVTSGKLATDSVTTAKIEGLAVTTAKIRDSAVTTVKIDNTAVTSAKIGAGAVTTSKIGDLQVTNAKLAANAVTAAKIGEREISVAKLNFAPIVNITAGTGITVFTTGPTNVVGNLGRTVSANFGTGSSNVARGDHNHGGRTGSAAGHTHTITSSKRFKKDISDYVPDIKNILSLSTKKFKYRNEKRDYSLGNEWDYGFIAEDLVDLGLTEVIKFDSEGLPEAINYGLFSAMLLEVIKDQQGMIDSLAKDVQDLKDKLK
jgi:hypothetical protein